ncbi:MAG: excalibur calcium-binding domain-containing protein [Pseudonocardia sp.]
MAPRAVPAPAPVPAGAAPIRRGEPGYSSKLDRDDDGVGCEN